MPQRQHFPCFPAVANRYRLCGAYCIFFLLPQRQQIPRFGAVAVWPLLRSKSLSHLPKVRNRLGPSVAPVPARRASSAPKSSSTTTSSNTVPKPNAAPPANSPSRARTTSSRTATSCTSSSTCSHFSPSHSFRRSSRNPCPTFRRCAVFQRFRPTFRRCAIARGPL